MFGGIVYGLVGLVPTVYAFWKFMLTLVLFNLTTASVVLWLSIAFSSISVASLVGTLVMLFKYVRDRDSGVDATELDLGAQLAVYGALDQQRDRGSRASMVAHGVVLPCCV